MQTSSRTQDRRAGALAGGLGPHRMRRVLELLQADGTGNLSLNELALRCDMSRSGFAQAFRQTTGLPPHRWLLGARAARARDLLRQTDLPIIQIALDCGFADQSHLTRVFSRLFQVSPGAWRRQCRD